MKFKLFAKNTTYYSMEVEAENINDALKIAENSCGSQWREDCVGDWIIEDELTETIEAINA